MAKKTEEPKLKKECPSCGLGIASDSKMCEFCGWDFEEEDEWILQIEKLEHELLTEKRRFGAGTVDQKIEATLHSPTPTRPQTQKQEDTTAPDREAPVQDKTSQATLPRRRRAVAPRKLQDVAPVNETIEVEDRRIRTVRGAPEPERSAPTQPQPPDQSAQPDAKVRHLRTAKEGAAADEPIRQPEQGKTRKVRVVRKVKQ